MDMNGLSDEQQKQLKMFQQMIMNMGKDEDTEKKPEHTESKLGQGIKNGASQLGRKIVDKVKDSNIVGDMSVGMSIDESYASAGSSVNMDNVKHDIHEHFQSQDNETGTADSKENNSTKKSNDFEIDEDKILSDMGFDDSDTESSEDGHGADTEDSGSSKGDASPVETSDNSGLSPDKQKELNAFMSLVNSFGKNGDNTSNNSAEKEFNGDSFGDEESDAFTSGTPDMSGLTSQQQSDLEQFQNIINSVASGVDASAFDDGHNRDFADGAVEQNEIQRRKEVAARAASSMRFMTTKKLMNSGFDKYMLEQYYDKIVYKYITKNRFNYLDRGENSKNGLYTASVVLSNFHYCCTQGACDLKTYTDALKVSIANGEDKNNNHKYALGILEDLENCDLEYDQMPPKLSVYLERYKDIVSDEIREERKIAETMANNVQRFMGEDFRERSTDFDESRFVNKDDVDDAQTQEQKVIQLSKVDMGLDDIDPFYKYDETGNLVFSPRSTTKVWEIPANDVVEASINKFDGFYKFKRKLFECRYGTSFEFKKCWDKVLDTIEEKYKSRSMVTRIAIIDPQVNVNGQPLLLNTILGGEYDIRLEDIVSIKQLLRKFPNLQQLVIDMNGAQCIIREYGCTVDDVWKVFQEGKKLQMLGIIPAGSTETKRFYRQKFAQQVDDLEELLDLEACRIQIDQFADSKNPRFSEKRVGRVDRFWKRSRAFENGLFARGGWGTNPKSYKVADKKWKKAGWTVAGAGAFLACGALTLVGKAASGIHNAGSNKVYDMFR